MRESRYGKVAIFVTFLEMHKAFESATRIVPSPFGHDGISFVPNRADLHRFPAIITKIVTTENVREQVDVTQK